MSVSLLEKLVKNLFHPTEPPRAFVESLIRYLRPMPTTAPHVDSLLNEISKDAFVMYKKLPVSEATKKLLYVFICLSNKQPTAEEELRLNIKKGALGFEVSFFNPVKISHLRDKVGYAVYSLASHVYSKSLIYKKIKIEMSSPVSITHKNFLQMCAPTLREYEAIVLGSEYDLLTFYSDMYLVYQELDKVNRLNDLIKERRCFRCGINPPKDSMATSNIPLSLVDGNAIDPDLAEYQDAIYQVYNECTRSYLQRGSFDDPHSEYFIRSHVLDYGLIPPFVSKSAAETVAYIGKYSAFLRSINSFSLSSNVAATIRKLDLSKKSSVSHLKGILKNTNELLRVFFIEKYKVLELLEYIHSTFLFGRVDFIECFFNSLKESRKITKKNILAVLEGCLATAFPGSPFNGLVDIYISQDESIPRAQHIDTQSAGYDSFSLYCKINYPVSVLLEEEFVLKLVYIFKFLWKLKKIDHLSRRIGDARYVNLVQKMMYYAFNEVIGGFEGFGWSNETFSIDILKKDINKKLDQVMKRLFINTQGKKAEYLLFYMEKSFVDAGKGGSLDDSEVQSSLKEFYDLAKEDLEGTYLFNLRDFLTY